jgi:hypothetical protein
MFAKVNPGLSRRFQMENTFDFPDYNDESLLRILLKKGRRDEMIIPLAVASAAIRSLAKVRAKPHFGNAGAVDNMLSAAKERMQHRDLDVGKPMQLTLTDFGVEHQGPDN